MLPLVVGSCRNACRCGFLLVQGIEMEGSSRSYRFFHFFQTVFNAVNIGLFTNLILPRVGEFIRCGVITRNSAPAEDGKQHLASYDKVLGTVVMERSWDVLTLMLILCTVMVTMWSRFGGFVEEKILQPFAGRFNADVWWIFAGLVLLCVAGVLVVWKLRNRSKVISALFGFVKGLWQGVVSCFKMKRWWVFLIYTALIWLMYWLMSWTILMSLSSVDVSALSLDFRRQSRVCLNSGRLTLCS